MKLRPEMEQKKSSSSSNNNKEDRYLGVAIHSQVKKIKQEMEKIKHSSLHEPEIRPVLREITRQNQKQQQQQQRFRSPLGLPARSISVGS